MTTTSIPATAGRSDKRRRPLTERAATGAFWVTVDGVAMWHRTSVVPQRRPGQPA